MDPKNWMSAIFILILVYLLANNASGTSTVVSGLGGQATNLISTLQGRGTSSSSISIPTISTGS